MPHPYTHLTHDDRDRIAILRGAGQSLRAIAKTLGRSHTTLVRELRRNSPPIHRGYYLAHRAQERAEQRARATHRRLRLKTARLRWYVRTRLQAGWSPELTAGRWQALHSAGPTISPEAIYQWVYAEARDLINCLPRHYRRRFPRGHSRKHRKLHIPARISITERPAVVATRRQAGHWESDTMVSRASRAALQVTTERKTRYSRLASLTANAAGPTSSALIRRLSQYPGELRRTITYDNGAENVQHERVNAVLGTRSYCCEPYHSWEKGTVENTIGLVRRFLPKGTDLAKVKLADLKRIERWLNHRPRKCLKFHTPAEVFRAAGALAG